jgi:threonine/homoserine/homoserine lactone efflux protein
MFGITPFVKPPANQAYIPPKNGLHGGYLRFVGQGMLLNLLNPFVYLFWITIVASVLPATLGANFSNQDAFLFLSGIILTVFVTDLSKAYIANNITNFLTAHLITRIDQVAGVCLMAFGFYLFYFAAYGGQPIH